MRTPERIGGDRAFGLDAINVPAKIVPFHRQLRQRLSHAIALRGGMLHRVTQRRRRVQRREHFPACGLDVALEDRKSVV